MKKILFAFAIMLACFTGQAASASMLEQIKERGKIIIGVKDMAPLFGFRDENGRLVGLEIDLARDIARRLGVELELFTVTASSRLQFLELERIDLVMATLAATEHRKSQVRLVEPAYYASQPALLVGKDRDTGSLEGKTLCVRQNAYFLPTLTERMSAVKTKPFRDLHQAVTGLANGECLAAVEENTRLIHLRRQRPEQWSGHDVKPLDLPALPWMIAIRPGSDGDGLNAFLSETVAGWHKSGKLIDLEKQWLERTTSWVADMHEEHN